MNYFAYGSNMLHERLQKRVPSVKPLGVATLKGYSLKWHKRSNDESGKCDIIETGNSADIVYGVLYEIDPYEKPKLDRAEGLGRGYDDKVIEVSLDGKSCKAITYLTAQIDTRLKPYDWYKAYVVAGAKQNKLPAEYIKALEQADSKADTDSCRRSRNERILKESQQGRGHAQ